VGWGDGWVAAGFLRWSQAREELVAWWVQRLGAGVVRATVSQLDWEGGGASQSWAKGSGRWLPCGSERLGAGLLQAVTVGGGWRRGGELEVFRVKQGWWVGRWAVHVALRAAVRYSWWIALDRPDGTGHVHESTESAAAEQQ
jgi:hypothetical protein